MVLAFVGGSTFAQPEKLSFGFGLAAGDKPPDPALRPLVSANLGFEIDGVLTAAGINVPDTSALADLIPWLGTGMRIASEQPFHHWELAFPEIMGPQAEHIGFDLVLGNPPWIKASWQDDLVLAEIEPMLGVREARSAVDNQKRMDLLQIKTTLQSYRESHRENEGACTFLNGKRNYPELAGVQTNLYKNFMVRAWQLLCTSGIAGLLHPEGPYDDAAGGSFRENIYPRLRGHYQFHNEGKLFVDVGHPVRFSINIYGNIQHRIYFHHMSNLMIPKTIGDSFSHKNIADPIPGIKSREGKWETRPHARRWTVA